MEQAYDDQLLATERNVSSDSDEPEKKKRKVAEKRAIAAPPSDLNVCRFNALTYLFQKCNFLTLVYLSRATRMPGLWSSWVTNNPLDPGSQSVNFGYENLMFATSLASNSIEKRMQGTPKGKSIEQ